MLAAALVLRAPVPAALGAMQQALLAALALRVHVQARALLEAQQPVLQVLAACGVLQTVLAALAALATALVSQAGAELAALVALGAIVMLPAPAAAQEAVAAAALPALAAAAAVAQRLSLLRVQHAWQMPWPAQASWVRLACR